MPQQRLKIWHSQINTYIFLKKTNTPESTVKGMQLIRKGK